MHQKKFSLRIIFTVGLNFPNLTDMRQNVNIDEKTKY